MFWRARCFEGRAYATQNTGSPRDAAERGASFKHPRRKSDTQRRIRNQSRSRIAFRGLRRPGQARQQRMISMSDFSYFGSSRNCALLEWSMSDHVGWSLVINMFRQPTQKVRSKKSRDSRLSCNKDMRFVVSTTYRWSLYR